MEQKWMTNLMTFLTGHNFLFLLIIILCSSCGLFEWDKSYSKYYEIRIKNNTKDTLLINTHSGSLAGEIDLNKQILYPGSYISEGSSLYDEESPIPDGFNEMRGLDSCWIYRYKPEYMSQASYYDSNPGFYYPPPASIFKVWYAPFEYNKETYHSFFDYNSWEVIDSTFGDYDGIICFVINSSDLTNIID